MIGKQTLEALKKGVISASPPQIKLLVTNVMNNPTKTNLDKFVDRLRKMATDGVKIKIPEKLRLAIIKLHRELCPSNPKHKKVIECIVKVLRAQLNSLSEVKGGAIWSVGYANIVPFSIMMISLVVSMLFGVAWVKYNKNSKTFFVAWAIAILVVVVSAGSYVWINRRDDIDIELTPTDMPSALPLKIEPSTIINYNPSPDQHSVMTTAWQNRIIHDMREKMQDLNKLARLPHFKDIELAPDPKVNIDDSKRYVYSAAYDRDTLFYDALPIYNTFTKHINASVIAFYDQRYVATQYPLGDISGKTKPNTICAFWSMVIESGSTSIVMLHDADKDYHKYWPAVDRTMSCNGEFMITTKSEKKNVEIDMTVSVLSVVHMSNQKALRREVTHYQIHNWPDLSTIPMRRFASIIEYFNNYVPPYDAMVVHCRVGIGRTGAFIVTLGAYRIIEADIKHHGTKISKWLWALESFLGLVIEVARKQRKNMLPSGNQYYMCYNALRHILIDKMKTSDEPATKFIGW